MNFSDSVEKELKSVFPERLQAPARDTLLSLDLPPDVPSERIGVAILKLSRGDIGKLAHFCNRAKEDWRDVLYWAECPKRADEPKSWEELKARLQLPEE